MNRMKAVLLGVVMLLVVILLSAQTYNWEWATSAGSANGEEGRAIAIDSEGNSYVTGYFQGTSVFGDITITTTAQWEIFIAKADMDGNWIWVKKVAGNATNQGWGIAVDSSSNVYVSGYFANTATFGPTTLTSYGLDDVFVTKLDSNGNWLWAKHAGGFGEDESSNIAVDADSNVYLTGHFSATATFGTTMINSSGIEDVFIAKLDSFGNWLWAKQAGGILGDFGQSISTDIIGNIYVTGVFSGSADFGSTLLTSSGDLDAFIVKLDSNGNWQWAVKAGGPTLEYSYSITVDIAANVYLTGRFSGTALFGTTSLTSNGSLDGFVAKMDSAGNWLWVKKIGGTGLDEIKAIKVDKSNNVYISGNIYGSIYFGSEDIAGCFIAKLDNEGNILWGRSLGGNAWVGGLDVDLYSRLYMTGGFYEPTSTGDLNLVSHGGVDIFIAKLSTPPFYDIDASLYGVRGGSTAWGDYDNDGDLDILITGEASENSNDYITKLYRNDGDGVFTDTYAGLVGVSWGSSAWGDYDNDGNLDIVISGLSTNGFVSRIYHNDSNGVFTDINAGLTGVMNSSVDWGDYDNDGDLDIIIAGADSDVGHYHCISKIYCNEGNNTFTDISANLPGVMWGSVAWGDYDNDGDLDILLTGCFDDASRQYISRVFRNDGNGVFTNINAGLTGVFFSSAAWGDYDNDGDLDILLSGTSYNSQTTSYFTVSRVYRNDGNGTFIDIIANLTEAYCGSAAWGDYDNDGDLDILLTGTLQDNATYYSKIYRYEGNDIFTDSNINLLGVMYGSAAWGDYDNDMDLDILLTGWSSVDASTHNFNAKIYNNTIVEPNTIPSAPTNLRASTVSDYINFEWDAVTDAQTPTLGLNYVLRIGTSPGGDDISSPMSRNSGYRLLPEMGYANSSCNWKIKSTALPQGTDCYWSVQAIDTAFSGSLFSSESVFLPEPVMVISPALTINFPDTYLGYYTEDSNLWIKNTGRAVLSLDSFSFKMINSPYEFRGPVFPIQIAAGDSASIQLRFTPQTSRNVSDSLFIYNNSLNTPIAKIRLSGRGVIVPPKPPVSLQISMVGNNAILSWDAVTQTIFDTPIAPEYYLIFNSSYPFSEYTFQGATTGLSYTHPLVSLFQNQMFYHIVAYKYYGRDEFDYSDLDLKQGMTEEEVHRILNSTQ